MKAKIIQENFIVPIGQVSPNKWNPKQDYNSTPEGKKNFARIKKSMSLGQMGPILVRTIAKDQYEIINGYHRYCAALELGWEEIEIKNLGKLTDQEAKARALRTEAGLIPLDSIMTAKMLKELLGFDESMIDELPYTQEEAEEMEQMLNFDFDNLEKDLDGIDPGGVDKTKIDMGQDLDIKIPKERITDWLRLKEMHNVDSDKKMITLLIDQGLAYGLQD